MEFKYNDGGRAAAGYKGTTGDCAVRAISIVTGKPYQEIYEAINLIGKSERTGKRKSGTSNARTGVYRQAIAKYLGDTKWTPTMFIGQGCKVHLKTGELPGGKLLLSLSKHYCAVIDGVINDTFDPSRNGTRCVYGYYTIA